MKYLFFVVLFISLFFISCTVEESPIIYGKDACSYCKMNIVDQQHSAEIVTQKGKPYKYDAIECMVRELKERDENEIALFLISDYSTPGKLVDAKSAIYLISENLQSPMGANLTGFKDKTKAEIVLSKKNGKLYTWDEIKSHF